MNLGFRVRGLTFGVEDCGLKVQGRGARVWGLGLRVEGWEFGIKGVGLKI